MSFTLDVSKYVAKTKKDVTEVIQSTAIVMFRDVIFDSPVDTGRFRANWFCTVNNPTGKVVYNPDEIYPPDAQIVDRMIKKVESAKSPKTYYLTNNLPYAYNLEMGSSNQAPQGMVRKNINRFNALLEQEARKYK